MAVVADFTAVAEGSTEAVLAVAVFMAVMHSAAAVASAAEPIVADSAEPIAAVASAAGGIMAVHIVEVPSQVTRLLVRAVSPDPAVGLTVQDAHPALTMR